MTMITKDVAVKAAQPFLVASSWAARVRQTWIHVGKLSLQTSGSGPFSTFRRMQPQVSLQP